VKVPFADDPPNAERLLSALERIAMALELRVGIARPGEDYKDPDDVSAVTYTNDEEQLKKEIRREAYYARTGIRLPDNEDPPRPPGAGDLPPAWP
jgi:hypothetical protein